jgi:predicted transcriptional regulator
MASEARLLTVQFLDWLAARPRRYAEMREAWASTCPLNCAWEDAITEGLVRHEAGGLIVLTEQGRARLDKGARAAG